MVDKNKTSTTSKKSIFEFKSIKTKLTVIILVMLIISGTLLVSLAAFMTSNELEKAAFDKLNSVGYGASKELSYVMIAGKDLTTALSYDPEVRSILLKAQDGIIIPEEQLALSDRFAEFKAELSIQIDAVFVYDINGIIISSSIPSIIGRDDSGLNILTYGQKEPYVERPFIYTVGVPILPYLKSVYDDNGKQIGFVGLGHLYPSFDENVFATPGLGVDATNFLVDSDGTILSGIRGDYSPFLTKQFDMNIFPPGKNMAQAPGFYGYPEYIVKTPVAGTNWSIITTERVEEINDPIIALIMMMLLLLILVIIAGLVLTIFIANEFTLPIKILTESAENLALGNVNINILHSGSDEIGQLAESFRHICENTRQRVNAVQKVAAGDVNFRIIAASDDDVEGHALIQLKRTFTNIHKSLQLLANHSADGDLNYRADASQFQGVYRELFETLNQAFDLIINPLHETMRLSTSYSSGDYSDRFNPDIVVKGDFIPFKGALNQIGIKSSDALSNIRHGIYDINASAYETSMNLDAIANSVSILAGSSSNVSSLAIRNDAGLDQALTAMNDLADTVSEIAQRTTSVSELANQSSNLVHDGVRQAELAGKGMNEIMESFVDTSGAISAMSSHMDEIGGIVDIISGIAEQTNLLALNAAIEAARAGDAGLGFAVVANEVKSLAQESQMSAEHISSIIGNLQKMSAEMTDGMNKYADVMQSGNSAVNETITIFHQVNDAISDVSRTMSGVAAASEEQAASVEEITASLGEVRDMVQETAREATDSAVAAEEISSSLEHLQEASAESAALADNIEKQVNQFKV